MEYRTPRGPAIASPLTIYPLPIGDDMVDAWITLNPWLPLAGRGRLPAPHEPLPPITRTAMELWLPVHEPFIEALIDAGAIRDAWYIHCLRNPEASSNYHFTATQVSRLLKIRLLMMIERGDADAIVEALEAKAAFIRSLGDDPYASTARLHMRKLTTLRHYMERAINRDLPWTDAHLRRLMEMLDDLPRDDLLYRVALLERVGNHELALWYGRDRHGARQGTGGMPGSTWREHAALLEVLTAQVEVAKLPPHERQGQTRRLRRMISRIANDPHVQPGVFTAGGMRNFPGLIDDDRCGRIMVAISRAALGVERYYLSHGRLPENLDVLVPDYLDTVPIDPCNGRPIRFNRVQGGYVTWSIWYRPYLRGPLTPEYDIATFSGFGSAFAVRRPLPPD